MVTVPSDGYDDVERVIFPWGDPSPDHFEVGDRVGLFYSDHEHYIFDNPEGVVVAVDSEDDIEQVTVQVDPVGVEPGRLYLIARNQSVG